MLAVASRIAHLRSADGQIPQEDRRWAILEATANMNLELVQVLTDKWIIAELGIGAALLGGIAWFGYKMYGMHCEIAEINARLAESLARLAEIEARMAARL